MTGEGSRNAGTARAAKLLGPFSYVCVLVMAVAVVHDFFHFAGAAPMALGFCAPLAYVVLRMVLPRLSARLDGSNTAPQLPGARQVTAD